MTLSIIKFQAQNKEVAVQIKNNDQCTKKARRIGSDLSCEVV